MNLKAETCLNLHSLFLQTYFWIYTHTPAAEMSTFVRWGQASGMKLTFDLQARPAGRRASWCVQNKWCLCFCASVARSWIYLIKSRGSGGGSVHLWRRLNTGAASIRPGQTQPDPVLFSPARSPVLFFFFLTWVNISLTAIIFTPVIAATAAWTRASNSP